MCNYVALARETGDVAYLERAEALIADVHDTLGRDRSGKPLGMPDAPLSGGLRIGKVAPEGDPDGDGACAAQMHDGRYVIRLSQLSLRRRRVLPLLHQVDGACVHVLRALAAACCVADGCACARWR